MALASFNGGEAWYPFHPYASVWAADTSSFVLDASGEVVVLVCRVPKTGTIDRFGAVIQAVGNAPDNGLRFSLQGVSATTGLQDGSILESGNASVTLASGSVVTGFVDPGAFTTSHSVTRGDLVAFVIDFPSFVASDSVTIRGTTVAGGSALLSFPYSIRVLTTIDASNLPNVVAHYTDNGGSWESLDVNIMPVAASATVVSLDTGTTPDEVGALLIPSHACRLTRVMCQVGSEVAGSNFDLILYDSASSVLDTVSYDGDVLSSAGTGSVRVVDHWLSSPVTLTAGSSYRFVLKPSTTANVRMNYFTIADAVISAIPGKLANLCWTHRTDGGAWTDFNTAGNYRIPQMMTFGFDQFSDSASAGGGGTEVLIIPMD